MLLSVIADLHLTDERNAPQYDALRFAVESIRRRRPDALAVIGDMTCDGSPDAIKYFLDEINGLDIPKIMLAGNSDLRRAGKSEYVKLLYTSPRLNVGGYNIIALDDADGKPTAQTLGLLDGINSDVIVLKHHPSSDGGFYSWRDAHRSAYVIAGHEHITDRRGNDIIVQSLDPDKAIGEPPCVTYIDFNNCEAEIERDYFACPKPCDFAEHIGISCASLPSDIIFAAEHGIASIELHNISCDRGELIKAVEIWRLSGGKYLSLHMPECEFTNGAAGNREAWDLYTAFASEVKVSGATIHVPKVSVRDMEIGGAAWNGLLDFLSEMCARLPKSCVIGIENMHMTIGERSDDSRRFGYLPNECIMWKNAVAERLNGRECGILLDIGHARNNPPFSKRYQLGSWYALTGGQTVAYHIHQVKMSADGTLDNHRKFDGLYGPLISLASFFCMWDSGRLNKRPIFLEMRRSEYLEPSLKALI